MHQTSIVQDEISPKLTEKVDTILAKIEKMKHGYDYIIHLGKAFECVICKSIVKQPIFSNCCQRIIACSTCMQEWTRHSSSCPLCSSSSVNQLQLKGIDDVLNFANALFDPKSGTVDNTSNPHPDVVRVDDSDSDLELPPVIFRRSTS